MEIQLSKRLKLLRKKNEKTQDELAAFLGITSQSVSKWERCEGYPDITLLPKIAAFFHVSVDTLLGVDEIAKRAKIDEITAEYNRIRHHIPFDPNYGLDEGIELIRNALTGPTVLNVWGPVKIRRVKANPNKQTNKTKMCSVIKKGNKDKTQNKIVT